MARHNALKTDFFVTPGGDAYARDKPVSPALRVRMYRKFGGICQSCGGKTRLFSSSVHPSSNLDRAEIDHVIPRSRGGLTEEANLSLLCLLCNRRKSNG